MIQTRIEGKRGCGFRKPGGIYLIGPSEGHSCCKLPFPLTVCPCCGQGIKPSRGWTWVDAGRLFGEMECQNMPYFEDDVVIPPKIPGLLCPLSNPSILGKAGLIWIGEKFYKTPADFLTEASRMGISRRISAIPKDFKLGETWVLLAHRKDCAVGGIAETNESTWVPAIFSIFKPKAIEYVTKGDETEDDLERIMQRGMTPVKVVNRVPQ